MSFNIIQNKFLVGHLLNFNENNKNHLDFIYALNAALYNTTEEMYEYIYDTVCNCLDDSFVGKNLCEFKNDQCAPNRLSGRTMGCCYNLNFFCSLNSPVLCIHLKNKSCSANCISCKFITCSYLEKKGIKFRVNDFLLLNTYFNIWQKLIVKYSCFKSKSCILKRLSLLKS